MPAPPPAREGNLGEELEPVFACTNEDGRTLMPCDAMRYEEGRKAGRWDKTRSWFRKLLLLTKYYKLMRVCECVRRDAATRGGLRRLGVPYLRSSIGSFPERTQTSQPRNNLNTDHVCSAPHSRAMGREDDSLPPHACTTQAKVSQWSHQTTFPLVTPADGRWMPPYSATDLDGSIAPAAN